jgi:hypothetical protein
MLRPARALAPMLSFAILTRPARAAARFDCFQIGQTHAHFALRIRNVLTYEND